MPSKVYKKNNRAINMKKTALLFLSLLLIAPSLALSATTGCDLTIGVSLHPYFSWVENIVGGTAKIMPLIPPGSDPHTYQPMPADLEHLQNLDVLIINGLGHDEFVDPMLKATDLKGLKIVNTSKGLPLIPSYATHYDFEGDGEKRISYNSHTYLGITVAVQQIQKITAQLGALCPDQAEIFKKNSKVYVKRLRKMLAATLAEIDGINTANLRIATVHDGYAYLFQELGIKVSAVVQPRHGIEPSARQLQDTIKRIKRAKVNILFTELDYEKRYVDIIFQETGCRIYSLSHVSTGTYGARLFEEDMKRNMDGIVQALATASGTK